MKTAAITIILLLILYITGEALLDAGLPYWSRLCVFLFIATLYFPIFWKLTGRKVKR